MVFTPVKIHMGKTILRKSSFLPHVVFVLPALVFFITASAMNVSDLKDSSKLFSGTVFDDRLRSSEPTADISLDSTQYYIGGGDQFMISVIELPSLAYTGTVNENCDVYIPGLGIIKIGKKNLAQAKKIIADFVGSKLKKQLRIYVSLVKAKTAIVTVSGAVANPGSYRLSGAFRILDAIKMANNNTVPFYGDFNFREVECRNRDSVAFFDLFRFLAKNDCLQNPYVYPGDNISLAFASKRIFLIGSILYPASGHVPIKENESASSFFSLLSLDASADSSHIIIQRVTAGGEPQQKNFSMKAPEEYALADRDLIIISEKENYPSTFVVLVKGEVVRQGYYPFIKAHTTAEDIIRQAGGPTKIAAAEKAFIIRHSRMFSSDPKQNRGASRQFLTNGYIDNSVRPEINAAFFHMSASNDFCILRLNEHKEGILLEEDDEIVFPRKENYVYVSGSVKHPGAYEFNKDEQIGDYVDKAGGYTSKADRSNSFVYAQYGPVLQLKGKCVIEEGDIIVVPDSQQYKFLSVVFIPILSALAITISTIFVIINYKK